MEQKKRHIYQIKKTEFISDKDEIAPNSVNLQLIESSCLMSHSLNRNNIIESNNLIYLNGAFVIFYNFFQSNKQFAANVSEYPPVGMAGTNMGKNSVAVATQSTDKKVLQLAVYTLNEQLVPTHIIREELEFIDFCIFARNLILGAKIKDQYYIYVFKGKCCASQKIAIPFKRILVFENKVVVLGEKGLFQFDEQRHIANNMPQILYPEHEIIDYYEVDSETKILLTPDSLICIWCETNKSYVFDLGKNHNLKRMVKIGRNILLAHRKKIAVSHLIIGEQDIKLQNEYVYSQEKLKGGIINIQASSDQMHLALGVQVKEKDQVKIQNFIFNMSTLSRSTKLICPFIRMMPLGFDSGTFSSMVNVLSSNFYILIGSKISNLSYTSTIEKKRVFNLYEVPRFMSVHPLSYQLVCGFQGALKFYNRVQGEILEVWKQNLICSAASYSNTGNLVLCVLEDSSYSSLILYDCYKFQKTRMIPVSFLKLIATRIQWIDDNSSLLLTSSTQMVKLSVSTGQKLSEFRERQQSIVVGKIKSVEYDIVRDCALAGIKQGFLLYASKNSSSDLALMNSKVIQLGKKYSINFIKIVPALKIVFFGTMCGTLGWCSYPLRIKKSIYSADESLDVTYQFIQPMSTLKIHNEAINYIGITPNNRFLIVNIKKQGYFNFRMRWHKTFKDNQANFVFHQLGNPILNTIDVTSVSLYETNKDKLKIALDKRKACFNDLEEFRRECEIRMAKNLKNADHEEKEEQLAFINKKITDIEVSKQKKRQISSEIEKMEKQLQEKLKQLEQSYEKQMLQLYNQQDNQVLMKQKKQKQYDQQFRQLQAQCLQNLTEIQQNLEQNFVNFQKKYKMIIENAEKFKQRAYFQKQEEIQIRHLEIENRKNELQRTQVELSKITNDLSVKITYCRKQNERFCNRKSFLEHKIKFFQIQNKNCLIEAEKLQQMKVHLEKELKKLQINTLKKEKKLKMNIQVNETLSKYKMVYENMTKTTRGETIYINGESDTLSAKIAEMQKELEEIAGQNQKLFKMETLKNQIMNKLKSQNNDLIIKGRDILYYVKEVALALEKVKDSPQQQKQTQMKNIYNNFYEEKKIEELAKNKILPQAVEKNPYDQEKTRQKEKKILSEMKDRKNYVISNFNMLKDHNERAIEEINLNILQIKAQNYNLVTECNERKEQTIKKKRMLHQLIDSVKETQIYLDQMKNQSKNGIKQRRTTNSSIRKTASQIPFVTFQRNKEQKFLQKMTDCQSTKAGQSRYQFRKVLDVKRMYSSDGKNGRRIMTAKQNKGGENLVGERNKPQTAIKKGRKETLKSAITMKQKSVSKPTLSSFSRIMNKPSIRD